MLKSQKSQLTCSYCSNVVKDPIELPCEDSICLEHLSERDVIKENRIKCGECKQEFQIKDIEFKSIQASKKLKESQPYLGEEETSLKRELEESIKKFFEFYDKFNQNKENLDTGGKLLEVKKEEKNATETTTETNVTEAKVITILIYL